MNEIKTVRIHALSTAISPLSHMMGVQGNESILNRAKVMSGGQIHEVPVLSGNAIRHKMVREPGASHIVQSVGLYGKLNIDQANYLFYGGSLTESAIADNLKKIAEMQELLPLYRLLGGSLKNQVISGSLLVSAGTLVCDENRETLEKLLPPHLIQGTPELRSCEDYVSGHQYTRGDARKKPGAVSPDADTDDKTGLMIYSGQNVIAGAVFYHSFILQNVSRLEVGALAACVQDWQKDGGTIGGMARIGHGKLETKLCVDGGNFFGDEIDLCAYADEYRAHVLDNRESIVAWLADAFPDKPKAAKPPKTKEKDAQPQLTDYFGEIFDRDGDGNA